LSWFQQRREQYEWETFEVAGERGRTGGNSEEEELAVNDEAEGYSDRKGDYFKPSARRSKGGR